MVSIHQALRKRNQWNISVVCTGYLYGRCDGEFRNILPREVLEYSYVGYALGCRNLHLEARKSKLLEGCAPFELSSMFTVALASGCIQLEGQACPVSCSCARYDVVREASHSSYLGVH